MSSFTDQYTEISRSFAVIETELRKTKLTMVRIRYNNTKNKTYQAITQYGVLEKLTSSPIENRSAIDDAIEALGCFLLPTT